VRTRLAQPPLQRLGNVYAQAARMIEQFGVDEQVDGALLGWPIAHHCGGLRFMRKTNAHERPWQGGRVSRADFVAGRPQLSMTGASGLQIAALLRNAANDVMGQEKTFHAGSICAGDYANRFHAACRETAKRLSDACPAHLAFTRMSAISCIAAPILSKHHCIRQGL